MPSINTGDYKLDDAGLSSIEGLAELETGQLWKTLLDQTTGLYERMQLAERGPALVGILWTFQFIAFGLVGLRLYARLKVIQTYGWDDIWFCATVVSVRDNLSTTTTETLLTVPAPGSALRIHRDLDVGSHLRPGTKTIRLDRTPVRGTPLHQHRPERHQLWLDHRQALDRDVPASARLFQPSPEGIDHRACRALDCHPVDLFGCSVVFLLAYRLQLGLGHRGRLLQYAIAVHCGPDRRPCGDSGGDILRNVLVVSDPGVADAQDGKDRDRILHEYWISVSAPTWAPGAVLSFSLS